MHEDYYKKDKLEHLYLAMSLLVQTNLFWKVNTQQRLVATEAICDGIEQYNYDKAHCVSVLGAVALE